jgi:hypothetical protein
MQDQWFLITLAILIAIASQHQVPKEHQKLKSTVVSYVCMSVIFFVTGCTLKTKVLVENYGRWKIHLFVQLQCFFVFSLIMFGIVSAAASNRHFMDPGLLGNRIRSKYKRLKLTRYSWYDSDWVCRDNHFEQRRDDRAGAWKSSSNSGRVHHWEFPGTFPHAVTLQGLPFPWSLVYKGSTS